MKKHDSKPQPKLSVVSALKFFLKGNFKGEGSYKRVWEGMGL
jgi:hypothetical protein